MKVERDELGQYAKPMGEWSELDWKVFSILEEIPTDDNEDKTIMAYMADLYAVMPDPELLYDAWVVIANVSQGDWEAQSPDWQEAATRWRERWHETLTVPG